MNQSKLIASLNGLISEDQNSETMDIDLLSSLEIVKKINQQDEQVASAVSRELVNIATAVDQVVNAFQSGGRLIYIGAGTSGRLGVLDAVECVPTFGIDEGMVIALIAGGEGAMFKSQEGAEDSMTQAESDLKSVTLTAKDIVVGIAASGRTPYVIGGINYATQLGAYTVALSCNPHAEIAEHAQLAILPVVGAEPLTGSTRMKSGSAQKMVLNMLSTASMIRIGKTYKNLMVDVKASNQKLIARATRIIMQITGVESQMAQQALTESGMQVKLAIFMLLSGKDKSAAEACLANANGFLRRALEQDSV